MKANLLSLCTVIIMLLAGNIAQAQDVSPVQASDKLVMLLISDDIDAAEKMAFMYGHTAKKSGWFKEVTVVIWGPSAKLISENEKLQEKVKAMMADGIKVEACVACARQYGVDVKLKELGYDVKGMGTSLTNYLKSENKVISF
jgi:hypothetical protein